MLLRLPVFICLFFAGMAVTTAQTPATISGNVISKEGKPLAMASVILLKDSSFIAATITNEAGIFFLDALFQKDSAYTLQLSLVGFQSGKQCWCWSFAYLSLSVLLR